MRKKAPKIFLKHKDLPYDFLFFVKKFSKISIFAKFTYFLTFLVNYFLKKIRFFP